MAKNEWQLHGHWTEDNNHISYMWVRAGEPKGTIYYEDVPKVRAKKLPIRPDLKED